MDCSYTSTFPCNAAAAGQDLLPVSYFHNVFTLPHELKLLFDAAAQTLLEFGRGELGGKIGSTLVLHSWDQQLRPHYYLHALGTVPK